MHKSRAIAVAIIILITLFPTASLAVEPSQETLYLRGRITWNKSIILKSTGLFARVSHLELSTMDTPQSDYRQTLVNVKVSQNYNFETDEYGNKYLKIIWEDAAPNTKPEATAIFEVVVNAKTRKVEEVPYPIKREMVPESIKMYFSPTNNSESGLLEIQSKTQEIVQDAETDLEAIMRLSEWVRDNVQYQERLGETVKPASWVLKNQEGTCDEYTNLLMAMIRAADIPARYVAGFTYGADGWERHAWAEAYLPKTGWVPFDALYGENGWVDATHVKVAAVPDVSVILDRAKVEGYNVDIGGIQESQVSVRILEQRTTSEKEYLSLGLSATKTELEPGESVMLTAKITNTADTPTTTTIALNQLDLEVADPTRETLYLLPHQSKSLNWTLTVPRAEKESGTYTYPATVRTLGGVTATLDIKMEIIREITFEKLIVPQRVKAGQALPVKMVLRNSGNVPIENCRVSIQTPEEIVGDAQKYVYLDVGDAETLSFNLKIQEDADPGQYQLIMKAGTGDKAETQVWIGGFFMWMVMELIMYLKQFVSVFGV